MKGKQQIPEWIGNDLKKSGLKPEDFAIEPLQSKEELIDRLGFAHIDGNSILRIGGYWIPYPNAPDYHRLKLKHPIETDNGKVKYLSPKKEMGFGNHAYILPEVYKIVAAYNPDKPIFFTEGEKKTVKAILEGFPCIGLSGVWCFKDSENDFLPELDNLNLKHRKCYICFDSDITHKIHVRHAELRLAVELMNRGAQVFAVRLPDEENGDKNGFDDYLVRHEKDKFIELLKENEEESE